MIGPFGSKFCQKELLRLSDRVRTQNLPHHFPTSLPFKKDLAIEYYFDILIVTLLKSEELSLFPEAL